MATNSKSAVLSPRHSRAGGKRFTTAKLVNPATLITECLDIWTSADTAKKSGRGRSSGTAASVYGIKKLRELILELAVRGKLVPQDPKDETASELLKKIRAEKTKLIESGKLKTDKQIESTTNHETTFALPNGWAYSTLGCVVEIVRGITFPGSEKSKKPEKGRIACLRTSNVQDQIEWDDILYIREEFVSREDQILKPRDIVMSMANSRELVGKVALVNDRISEKTTFGGFLGVLRPFLIEPRFVMALLRTPQTRETLIDSASQTTNIANVSLAKLRPLCFAIPPLAEQHRIVAKVDKLMALCDQLETQHNNTAEAHEKIISVLLETLTQSADAKAFTENWQRIATHFDTLFTTETSIDALKQTLLQLAVMGKLVAQDPKDEPASKLLTRIRAKKARLAVEGRIKKDKLLAAISESEKQFCTPTGWIWVRFNSIASTRLGKMLDQVKNRGIHRPYLRNTNVQWNAFVLDDLKEMRFEEYELDEYRLNTGDLVICEGGEPGRSAVWENQIKDMFIQKALHRARPWDGISPYFLNMHLKADVDSGHLEQFFTGATIKHFSGEKLSSYPIALPPENEQHRIVAKVDELMTLCDQLKSRITAANQCQQKLADVMVEKAVT